MQPKLDYKYGDYTYGVPKIIGDGTLEIGKFCSIAENVSFILSGHHTNRFTTYPFGHSSHTIDCPKFEEHPIKGNIIVGNDVWIGYGAIISYGVKIGDGSIIAAGSLVTKNVKPYSVVGGNPSEFLYTRFNKKIIDILLELKWWDLPYDIIKKNSHILTSNNYDEILKFYNTTKNKLPLNIVQIGSNRGYDDLTGMVHDDDFLLLIEPLKEFNDSLRECYNFVKNIHIENYIITDDENINTTTLYTHKNMGLDKIESSILKSHILKHFHDENGICEQMIKCITINKLLDSYNLINIDILFIDAEGLDEKIIKSIDFIKYNINKIYYENLHIDNNSIEKFLNKYNYKIYKNILTNKWTNLAEKNYDQKLCVLSCCFNEEDILPFYLDYYTNFIKADKIIIYDGGSTDNTPNIVKDYSNVEFILDDNGKMDERNLRDIRNNGWKKYRNEYDWVIVCDMDEFIYHPNLKELLFKYKLNEITIAKVNGFDMISNEFPNFKKGKFLPSFIKKGIHEPVWLNKSAVFDPKKIEINYDYGTHSCSPIGDVNYSQETDIKLLQYKWLSHEYITQKSLKSSQRLSDWNLETGMASHYKEFAKITVDTFNNKYNSSIEIINDFPFEKKEIFQNIDGWFEFDDVYSEMVKKFPSGSHFVEIGSWMGKSTSYMAVEIANSGKKIKFDTIDTFEGSKGGGMDEKLHNDIINNLDVSLYQKFLNNIEPIKDYINSIRGFSYNVVNSYLNNSLDFVFIDGAHDYESVKRDIEDWYPKIKENGIIGGDDYVDGWPGVIKAVNEFFGKENVKIQGKQSWMVEKNKIVNKKNKNKRIYELLQSTRMFYNPNTDHDVNVLYGLKILIEENIDEKSVICEIGSFAGASSEMFALTCKEIYCVDCWLEYQEIEKGTIFEAENRFDNMMKNYNNIHKIKMTSEEASQTFPDKYFDLIYIDGAHDYNNVKKDILNWLPKVKDDGIISGHDYNMWECDVKKAVDEIFKDTKIKIYQDSSWLIQKKDITIKIVLVCIAKDEDIYIEEWLKYHHKLGFDHIFIYENNWKCNLNLPYLTKISWDGDYQQIIIYNSFIDNYKNDYDYVAFFDCDEFLVLKKHSNIHDFIKEYGNKNISVNWQFYGSGGKINRENNSLLKQFTKRENSVNEHIKTILYLKNETKMWIAHHPYLPTFDTNGKSFIGAFNPNGPVDVIVLNHYKDKTLEDFKIRIKRGNADWDRRETIELWEERKNIHNEVEDLTAYNFMYKNEIKISIIIPTYNRNKNLETCIESVLNQNYKNIEILICHDGTWVESFFYNDDRIYYFNTENRTNNYGTNQRNLLLEKVTGDYIIYLDDDNILYDNYINKMIEQIDNNTGMVICKIHFNDKNWTNLILPRQNKIIPCEIDSLNILIISEIAKKVKWDNIDIGHDHRYITNCEKLIIENNLQIKYINDVLANHQYIGEKKEKPIIIFNHNYLIGNWEEIVKEQLSLLKNSELYDKVKNIYSFVTVQTYNDEKQKTFEDIIKTFDYQNKIIITFNQKNNFEFDCLQKISEFCEGTSAYICYYHTKGVYSEGISDNIGVKSWRDFLNYFTITKWENNIEKLKDFDVVGVNYDFNDLHKDYVIGGNFFWTKSEYVKTLPFPKIEINRFEAERWILKNKDRKIFEFFNTSNYGYKNLYMEIIDSNIYKNKKTKINEIVDISFDKYKTQQNKWEYNEFLKKLVDDGKTNSILEIGSKYGGTTYGFCNIFNKVVSIDIFKEEQILQLENEYNNLTFILGDSHSSEVKDRLKGMKFDVVYIDGDHHYDAVKQDYLDYKEFVCDNGIIVFHDIKQTWWTDSIEIQVPILWNEIKDKYKFDEIINNENDCYGIGLLYKNKSTDEDKPVIIMTAHPNFKTSEEITKESLESLKALNIDTILSTHCPISQNLQNTATHFIFDKNNPLIRHDYYDQSWFDKEEYYALIKLHKNDNDLQHALAVYINYYNGILHSKSLGYTTAICTNFDIVFDKEDLNIISDKINEMNSTGKKSFFMTSNANEGIHYKTIFFITDIDFFIENFKYVTNENDYNTLTRIVGSETNCLENFFYQTLKTKSDQLLLQQINENDLFSKSKVNLFSNIEYFTILPLKGDSENFVVWFSSSNSFDDNRNLTIKVFDETDCIYVKNDQISKNYVFFKKIKFERHHKYLIYCQIKYNEMIKEKQIIIENESFDKLNENGEFWDKQNKY